MYSITKATLGLALLLTTSSLAQAQTTFEFVSLDTSNVDHIVVFVGENGELTGSAKNIDTQINGGLAAALKAAAFKGAFGKKLHLYNMGPYTTISVLGTGDESLSARQLRELGGHLAMADDNDVSLKALVDGVDTKADAPAAQLAMGYGLGAYSFTKYKKDATDPPRTVSFASADPSAAQHLYRGDLEHIVTGVHFARDMGTEPGKSIYPEAFAQRVRDMFKGMDDIKVEVLGLPEMRRKNMGALIGVGQGSIHDPRLVIVSYTGAAKNDDPIALVGKGITFDTGGISIKSNTGQWKMKSDLSGAAAVAGTVYAAAKRGENVNLVGVMAMAENMPARDAIRPGDVLETMSGTTIEVISTDAEGRLVLSDAITYTQEMFDPRLLVNIATLTGSAGRALGDDYAAVVTRDWDLSVSMMEIGKTAGEDVWPMPLNDNHFDAIKSDIADIKNSAGSPGVSIGAADIGTFVDEDRPWIHIDMASVDWLDKGRPTSPKGHSGWGVRFMDELVRAKRDEGK